MKATHLILAAILSEQPGPPLYVAPTIAVNEFQSHLQGKQIVILDAGCGTGLVGALLSEKGYRIIDGLDYSPQMLEKANEKQVYRDLAQADLTASLDISDNQYDAVISVGTFTCAHVGPVAFNELLRITKPGGYISAIPALAVFVWPQSKTQ